MVCGLAVPLAVLPYPCESSHAVPNVHVRRSVPAAQCAANMLRSRTGERWPRKMRTHCPEAASHRRTLWSADPVARYWHTGCHRTTSTSDWCPATRGPGPL
jgi:hypothetical protein